MPLALGQVIAASETTPVIIKTTWGKYRDYRVGDKSRRPLGAVLNRNDEIEVPRSAGPAVTSFEERLNELKAIRDKGLIGEGEYNRFRQKTLAYKVFGKRVLVILGSTCRR